MTKAFLIFSILLGSLLSFPVLALTIQDDWKLEDGTSLSKNDIIRILERVGDRQVNDRKFDLEEVQSYFKSSDYHSSWDTMAKYKQDYGTSNLSKLLLYTAMLDYAIKQDEKRFKMTIPSDQQVEYEGYDFNMGVRYGPSAYVKEDFENACVVALSEGESETECYYDEGSSGLLGLSIFLLTRGQLGGTDGRSPEYTSCSSTKGLNVLVRTLNKKGEEILTYRPVTESGSSTIYHKNAWFRGPLKQESRRKAEIDYNKTRNRLLQYTCDRHRPSEGVRVQPLAEIEDRLPTDLDNDDVIDAILVPIAKDSARTDVSDFDRSHNSVTGQEQDVKATTHSR